MLTEGERDRSDMGIWREMDGGDGIDGQCKLAPGKKALTRDKGPDP